MKKYYKNLHWIWLGVLIVINLIPIGNGNSGILSRNKLFIFRLDYVVHAIMILVFAWLWVFSRLRGFRFFEGRERLKYAALVLSAGLCLEFLQLAVPWRSFNPVDMYYNLIGAGVTALLLFL